MNIYELDLSILNYGRLEPDNLDGDLCMVSEDDLEELEQRYRSVVICLIKNTIKMEEESIAHNWEIPSPASNRLIYSKELIVDVTKTTWDKIKELI